MIQKQYCSLSDAISVSKDKPLVIQVDTTKELNKAVEIHMGRHGLRGIKFESSLLEKESLQNLKKSKANYFEITLQDQTHITLAKEHCYSKNTFTQITVPYSLFSTNQLKKLQLACNRLVIDLKDTQLTKEQLNSLFAELITHKFYPFFQNADSNEIEAQFRVEYFQNKLNTNIIENKGFSSDGTDFLNQRQEGDLL